MKGRVGGATQMYGWRDAGVVKDSEVIRTRRKGWKKLAAKLALEKQARRERHAITALAHRAHDLRPRLAKKAQG